MRIRRRKDVDPQNGIRRYGEVEFADPVNKLYPIDTPGHVRSAWARVHIVRNAMFYTPDELDFIKLRIIRAAERLGVELSEEIVERDARLFAAGDYPDRGIEFTEEDLDRMVQNHKPVPIRVEHVDSPLELGWVGKIWRNGGELFGRLAFKPQAWALITSCGAKKLSAAVKRDKSGLVEVSIVRHPRVDGAAIFRAGAASLSGGECSRLSEEPSPSSETCFEFEIDGGCYMSDTKEKELEFARRISELERLLMAKDVDAKIDSLKRDGKLAPAAEDYARAILGSSDVSVVTFADGTQKPVAEAFLAFLDAQPKVIEFAELARGANESVRMSDSQREICDKLGISPEMISKHASR